MVTRGRGKGAPDCGVFSTMASSFDMYKYMCVCMYVSQYLCIGREVIGPLHFVRSGGVDATLSLIIHACTREERNTEPCGCKWGNVEPIVP